VKTRQRQGAGIGGKHSDRTQGGRGLGDIEIVEVCPSDTETHRFRRTCWCPGSELSRVRRSQQRLRSGGGVIVALDQFYVGSIHDIARELDLARASICQRG